MTEPLHRSTFSAVAGSALPILGLVLFATVVPPAFGESVPPPADADASAEAAPPLTADEIADDWIRPEDVSDRADSLQHLVEQRRIGSSTRDDIDRIQASLRLADPALEAALEQVEIALTGQRSLMGMQDARREFQRVSVPFPAWKQRLEDESRSVAEILAELDSTRARWARTLERPEIVDAGRAVARRVELTLAAIETARKGFQAWRVRLLSLEDRLLDRTSAIDEALDKLEEATLAQGANLLVPTHPPIWNRDLSEQLAQELPKVPAIFAEFRGETLRYLTLDSRPFLLQGLIALALLFAMRGIPAGLQGHMAGSNASSQTLRLLERPYAIAFLLALLMTPPMHPTAPQRVMQIIGLIALVPAARILSLASERSNLSLYLGLALVMIANRLILAVAQLPAVSLLVQLAELVLAALLVFEYRRRLIASGGPALTIRLLGVGLAGLAVAIAAEIGGWSVLGQLLGRGVLVSGTLALFAYAAVISLEALLAYGLASPTLRRSRFIDRNQVMVQRWSSNTVRFVGLVYWLRLAVASMGLQQAARDAVHGVLDAGVSVGALSISVGGVLSFVLTLVVAVFFSRFVHELLEDEIFPRARLPRGIPHALMALTNYAIYSLGFLLALAAAGVELGQLSIMLGGLGVGIGLGLQDVVKNFAAGITILLERRVHVGDAVQIPEKNVFGRVLSIGIRASVVRNWNGTEVIMPNDDLVAGTVTNWTLSDARHRLEVSVGVAYGTDPEVVIALLLKVAGDNERILESPPPNALFRGFGDSSLDFTLRAWSDEGYETAAQQTSELGIAVNRALQEAGITIPFPQRDLHLATISENVGSALQPSPARSA